MKKYPVILLAALALVACNKTVQKAPVSETGAPPQLWSYHKVLEMPLASCASKAKQTLEALDYHQVVQANDSAYGNSGSNRAIVKCAEIPYGSLIYLTVGGPDAKAVEKLRNAITAKL